MERQLDFIMQNRATSKHETINQIYSALASVLYIDNFFPLDLNVNLEELGLDSINFVNLIIVLEDLFNVQIPEDRLVYRNFITVEKIYETLGGVNG